MYSKFIVYLVIGGFPAKNSYVFASIFYTFIFLPFFMIFVFHKLVSSAAHRFGRVEF